MQTEHATIDVNITLFTWTDRILGAYFLLSAVALLFPGRPRFWFLLLALHLALAAVLLSPPLSHRLLRPLYDRSPKAWQLIRLWTPLIFIPLIYREIPILNQAVHQGAYFDYLVQRWEGLLFELQPSWTLAREAAYLWLSEMLHAAYLSYYLIILVPPLLLYRRGHLRDLQTMILILLLAAVAHYLIFIYFPVRGPRYLWPTPTAGLIETGLLYRLTHNLLETGSSLGTAFPSGHVGISTAQTFACMLYLPRLAPIVGLLTLGIAVGTVYGRFHYVVDVLAGIILGITAVAVGLYIRRYGSESDAP